MGERRGRGRKGRIYEGEGKLRKGDVQGKPDIGTDDDVNQWMEGRPGCRLERMVWR